VQQQTPSGNGSVRASPTKRFFIAVLIKDIQFIDAIVELVDNSVDAARASGGDLSKIHISIDYSGSHFAITDNAGGMSIETAKYYAFRFGKRDGAPSIPGAVGEFGVGMKRALFKIGGHFTVESSTSTDHFLVSVDVEKWHSEPDLPGDWTFPMQESGPNPSPHTTGTTIKVTDLFDYAKDELSSLSFGSKLMSLLREAHSTALTAGLQISVGTTSLQAQIETLLQSAEMSPLHDRP
jgi:hypothetical protein